MEKKNVAAELAELVRDRNALRRIVARMVSIKDFLPDSTQLIRCPFHSDSTPSAKFYEDEDCVRLFCYACKKQYTSFDYIQKVLEQNPLSHLRSQFKDELIVIAFRQAKNEPAVKRNSKNLLPLAEQFSKDGDLLGFLKKAYEPNHV